MDWNFLFWIGVLWCACVSTAHGGPVYTDCERPPTILHGRTDLTVDDEGISVIATYSCEAGYLLLGQAQLTCNTDTDEWQGDLPACKLEIGNNSSVSEIEPAEVIEPVVTVPADVTHEEVKQPEPEPEKAEANDIFPETANVETEEEPEQVTQPITKPTKRRRKGKVIEEDNYIDIDFASRLDTSCIEGPTAPPVNDAYVVEYIRARKEDYTFLVAVYACDEDFELEAPHLNRLYCSQSSWVGSYPICIDKSENDLDYGPEPNEDERIEYGGNNEVDKENAGNPSVSPPSNENEQNEKIKEAAGETGGETGGETSGAAPPDLIHNSEDVSANEIGPIATNSRSEVPAAPGCDVDNGGCQQLCQMAPDSATGASVAKCSCESGFLLEETEGKACIDINECENPAICPNGCENTIGSYRCIVQEENPEIEANPEVEANPEIDVDSEIEVIPTSNAAPQPNAPVKACGDGLRLDASNNCIDIDECAEGNTGCEYCQNIIGGFQCTCPDGFVLNNDEKTCKDIDECTTYSEYDYDENTPTAKSICSHECVNTVGSFICLCPINFHLRDDKKTCEQDFCRHLGDTTSNKSKCSHDCVDSAAGYQCKCPDGMDLDADMKTCLSLDACASSGDRCLPGKCINVGGSFDCECPTGFAAVNQRCIDYDECAIATHKCSHDCRNIDGSYLCECPDDLMLASDGHTCVSTDSCANANGGCSDICNVVNEKVVCSCPDGSELDGDQQTCRSANICDSNNGGCQHVCSEELNRCECFPGYETFDEGKTCHDINECLTNNGGCTQQCINNDGGFDCTCFEGFVKDDSTGQCVDRNECAANNGNCDHECTNTEGSYLCSCRPGYRPGANQHQCIDINECESDNGQCSHTCVNLQGSYQCSCPEGFKLDHDKVTCVEIKDRCVAIAAPANGDVRCTRSRHSSQLFYRTKCSIWCDSGYTLIGPNVKYCNGTDGIWNTEETTCVPSTCPPLTAPAYGVLPANCLNGKIYPGESCAVICPPGFKSTGEKVAKCLPGRHWSTTNLSCAPIRPKTLVEQGEVHSRGQVDLDQASPPSHRSQNILRPYIKCPLDTKIALPKGQKTIYVKLEQPKSNVDWATHVDAHPAWAKNLQAHLTAGVHTITFRARSPNLASVNEVCRTVITVVNPDVEVVPRVLAPEVVYCPGKIDVQLQPTENHRAVFWKEPVFRSTQLKQIFKTYKPGTKFAPGQHQITYIATDIHNQNATCQFAIAVHPAVRSHVQYHSPLSNHESYLLCSDKPAMKLQTSFPIQIPPGCIIKNVRLPQHNLHRRRHAISPNNHFLRYYSSWNQPLYNRYPF